MPTSPNGVPSGRCGDSLPSLANGASLAGSIDAVNPFVGDHGARPLLVELRVVLDQPHLSRFVDGLAGFDEINAAIEASGGDGTDG